MQLPRHHRRRLELRRRTCAAVTLLAYLVTALGIPLPVPAAPIDDEPFPCRGGLCGCSSAKQFWAGCCCYTPVQRLAWAKSHNVKPPPHAEKPKPAASCCSTQGGGCCGHCKPGGSCCQKPEEKPPETPPDADEPDGDDEAPTDEQPISGLVVAPWQCQGMSVLWVSSGAALPAVPPTGSAPPLPPAGCVLSLDVSAHLLPAIPPDPPPRSFCR